jgi:Fic/DOC family
MPLNVRFNGLGRARWRGVGGVGGARRRGARRGGGGDGGSPGNPMNITTTGSDAVERQIQRVRPSALARGRGRGGRSAPARGRGRVSGGARDDECAIRFGYRLVVVHPFPNGNGRWSRLVSDALIVALGGTRFSWGGAALTEPGRLRRDYITALAAADADGDLEPLIAFARR